MIKYDDITQLTNEQIAESCEDAADLLEGRWIQGDWSSYVYDEDDNGPAVVFYCVEGGLAAALGMNISNMEDKDRKELLACPVYNAVLETLNHQVRDQLIDSGADVDPAREWYGTGDLPNWNDHEDRTEQEVVDLLRKTAKRVMGVPV